MRWIALCLLAACSSAPKAVPEEPSPETKDVPDVVFRRDLPVGSIYRTSRPDEFEAMCDELAPADVVYVGEIHTNEAHHKAQLLIIHQMHAHGRLDAIGLEMFQRPFQEHLDDYVAGRIDEATMLEKTEWKKRWGYKVALYRPIFEFAREHRIALIALNVSNELRKIVSKDGYEALTVEQRAQLPAPDRDFPGYSERFEALVRAHTPGRDSSPRDPDPKMVARYNRVQMLWDDVMADSVVQWMRNAPKESQMVVLVGGGHIRNGWGIPARVHRRQAGVHKTVVLTVGDKVPAESLAQSYADFVWITR